MNEKIYESPQLMEVELEIEQDILQASSIDYEEGWSING